MVDEKWFYMFKQGQRYYLGAGEELPVRKVQHKSHIQKVMFLAVAGRSRRDTVANRSFDGKIGIFPFMRRVPAQRSSRNRAAGTMETKMVEVTKAFYKQKMLDEVFPAIKRTWPGGPSNVSVQQDNAPAHRINDDPDIVAAGTADDWNIRLINQPPNSPDTNILDLGFFNSIQSLQDRTTLRTVDELIEEVRRVFAAQESAALGRVWTTYQAVLQEIKLAKGDNTFKLPHLHKQTAERRGVAIPASMPVSEEAWPCGYRVTRGSLPVSWGGGGGGLRGCSYWWGRRVFFNTAVVRRCCCRWCWCCCTDTGSGMSAMISRCRACSRCRAGEGNAKLMKKTKKKSPHGKK